MDWANDGQVTVYGQINQVLVITVDRHQKSANLFFSEGCNASAGGLHQTVHDHFVDGGPLLLKSFQP